MAAARHRAPILVLHGHVDLGAHTDEPGYGSTEIECASKKAYGCGEHDGQEAVEGLALYARLEPSGSLLTSSLAIRMSGEAHRRFDAELELGVPNKDMFPPPMEADGFVQMAGEQGLTAIVLAFHRPFRRGLVYYLVYDHADSSLSMIRYLPDFYIPTATMKPLPKRRRHRGDLELFVLARRRQWSSPPAPRDVLCVCTPETRAADPTTGPWQIKTPRFQFQQHEEEIQKPFNADVAFSFQGKGFWADLSRGLVYCDLHATSDPVVDFGFIPLPPECRPNLAQMEELGEMEWPKLTRTVACVRASIWFVCIHQATDYGDALVKMWTLDVPAGGKLQEGRWEQVEEVPVRVLWGLDSFKEAGLPRWPLQCPALTPDGALCVVLADQTSFRKQVMPAVDTMLIFKLHGERRLLFDGVVHDYYVSDPVICPPNFLQRKHRSRETKVDERHPAAGRACGTGGE
ncbi:unnamed protein product [Urochloa humidicola]